MKFSIGFSPCPNDTFIFDALVNYGIDTDELTFDTVLEDVEWLNEAALQGKLDICKVSYAVVPLLSDKYRLLSSGGALGRGVGPLLICRDQKMRVLPEDLPVALPGQHTTAHLLFSYAYPGHAAKQFLRYDEIESFVQSGKGAGVIIHENRFTYSEKGLYLLNDLGAFWEKNAGHPIPLGGIVIRKDIPEWIQLKVSALIADSLRHALQHPDRLSSFVTSNAMELSEEVMRKHIRLYVNDFSLGLNNDGIAAIKKMTEVFNDMFSAEVNPSEFLPIIQ